jgi:hypothetical protein
MDKLIPTTPLILPKGYRQGLLPRTDQPGDSCPFIRSAPGFNTIPQQDWKGYIEDKANLSGLVWSVFNQGSVGSCASEAVCGSLKIIRAQAGLPQIEANPYGIYGRVNGGSDRGSSLSANLTFIRDKGAFPESVWPRSKGWRAKPSQEAYDAAYSYRIDEYFEVSSWDELATALLRGWVIYWGYSGHAIVGVDLLNDSQFMYLNSWGSWGSGTDYSTMNYGFGVANRSSIMWGYGVYACRTSVIEADLDITV